MSDHTHLPQSQPQSGVEGLTPGGGAAYSLQGAGDRTRVMVTTTASPAPQTRALLTAPLPVATDVAAALTALAESRVLLLHAHAATSTPAMCDLRRHLMRAVLDPAAATGVPALAAPVVAAAAACTEAQRRAIGDEVGSLLAGTETVIVAAVATNSYGETIAHTVANGWLAQDAATVEDARAVLEDVVDPTGPSYLLYEGLLAHWRTEDPDLDTLADTGWVDVDVDRAALAAWIAHTFPELTDEVTEIGEAQAAHGAPFTGYAAC